MAMSWQAEVGINHTPAYQVSGRPFASASVVYGTTARVVNFPYVTRWFQIINKTAEPLKVGFSEKGVTGAVNNYYFTVDRSGSSGYGTSPMYEMKVSSLWFLAASAGTCDVVAGLTTVPPRRASGSAGPNFSGSTGVG